MFATKQGGKYLKHHVCVDCRVMSLCFAPASIGTPEQVVAGHEDGSLRTWDCRKGACVRAHRKKGPEATAVAVMDRWGMLL